MSLRTYTFRQLGRDLALPTFHCTQVLGQRPLLPIQTPTPLLRTFQTTSRTSDCSFTNLLADAGNPPPDQVPSISDEEGIRLVNGLVLSAASIFWRDKFTHGMFLRPKRVRGIRPKKTNGKGGRKVISSSLTLWFRNLVRVDSLGQLPRTNKTPIPEILLLGTGKRIVQPPPFMRTYLNNRGIQLDVMDTVSPM